VVAMNKQISSAVRSSLATLAHAAAHVGELARSATDPCAVARAGRVAQCALDVAAHLAEAFPDEVVEYEWDTALTMVSRELRGAQLRVQHRWLQSVEPVSEIEHAAAMVAFRVVRDAAIRCVEIRAVMQTPNRTPDHGMLMR
jgi:hypothetical protein